MTIERENINFSYIVYDVLCPSCGDRIFLAKHEVAQEQIKCNSCHQSHILDGDFQNEVAVIH